LWVSRHERRRQANDRAKIEDGIRLILHGIGEDPSRPGLLGTPGRVADMYEEIFGGLSTPDPTAVLSPLIGEYHREMVLVRDINFYSMFEHHLLPFAGTAHVAYIPSEQGSIVGLSKLVRLVHVIAARPQLQERITSEVADAIVRALEPDGVLLLIEAEHLCMSMRGVKTARAKTVTSAVRGLMRSKSATRNEALALESHG
jgi:GTP cyclohydrolase IA